MLHIWDIILDPPLRQCKNDTISLPTEGCSQPYHEILTFTAPCETGVRTAFLANKAQAHNFSLEFSLNVPEIHLVPFSP
jgi:hypothetical protein